MTHQAPFDSPVRITLRHGETTEIRSAQEAFRFLLKYPEQESPIFESALEACFVATIDPACRDEALRGLAAFAKSHGLLAETSANRHSVSPGSV